MVESVSSRPTRIDVCEHVQAPFSAVDIMIHVTKSISEASS
jgi:hypothetical protein